MRRATLYKDYALVTIKISIHALREESDQRRGRMVRQGNISIHALREESDPYGSLIKIGIRGIRGIRDKEGLM